MTTIHVTEHTLAVFPIFGQHALGGAGLVGHFEAHLLDGGIPAVTYFQYATATDPGREDVLVTFDPGEAATAVTRARRLAGWLRS